jgi:hypothetical protein
MVKGISTCEKVRIRQTPLRATLMSRQFNAPRDSSKSARDTEASEGAGKLRTVQPAHTRSDNVYSTYNK